MAKNFDVVTVGGAARDITFYTGEGRLIKNPKDPLRQEMMAFEYGAKIIVEKSFTTFGGGAANAAVCFSRLGLKTAAMVRVGNDDEGRSVINNFKKNKVAADFVQIDKKAKTGFSFIATLTSANDHTAFLYRGANDNLRFMVNSSQFMVGWFYVASLSGSGWRSVMDAVVAKKIALAWNPGNVQLAAGLVGLRKYLSKTKILFTNLDEAIQLVTSLPKYKKMPVGWLVRPANLFKVLADFCPGIIVITNGGKGAHVFDGSKFYYQKSLSKKIVDTTGAGDSFCSSFTAGYIFYHGNIEKALKLGAINSAYNLTGIGAQDPLLTRAEAERRIKN